ncbi:hypothetical protein BTA51_22155 [Hahella sp. CCB-MM4]|uniref:hypothetical protein n=1 Tax=Hahella sp. (strain CCB-MM4) TaxID=1926491 RepID=UPI000B9A83D9|nr:hypothetical protein [Hahella sp. CCB-MM4]OZG71087.1 hypothetical protein BTA51_22155 [Hahella sp. CCB-MM4]
MHENTLRQLKKEKLIADTGGGLKTTARWQAAVLRAVTELMGNPITASEDSQDLRIAFAKALHGIYGDRVSEEEMTDMLLAMLQLETESLQPTH